MLKWQKAKNSWASTHFTGSYKKQVKVRSKLCRAACWTKASHLQDRSRKFWLQKLLSPNDCLSPEKNFKSQILGHEKLWFQRNFQLPKNFGSKNVGCLEIFGFKKFWVQKQLGPEIDLYWKFLAPKKCWSQKKY